MKSTFLIAAIAALSTVSAYQCPPPREADQACESINVFPLTCSNTDVNAQCNDKQCNQPYIDNYAACQCRSSPENFFDNSVNVEGLLQRCGLAGLANPFGSPDQYRPGQGTKVFAPSSASLVGVLGATNASIIAPTTEPSGVPAQSHHISGGSIAGIVLGCLAATALAGLLGWCWRKKRHQHASIYDSHTPYDNRGPTRTVVTEKIEPVVVRSVPAGAGSSTTNLGTTGYNPGTAGYNSGNAGYNSGNTGYNAGNTGYNAGNPGYSTTTNPGTTHGSHDVNTHPTTTTGYNTQPRTGVVGGGH
ncbi:hypothetical protein BGZ50_001847 [Haplosporangium sp. Z 11]|nr:hypothetical protein BGZ50_001847 [Haplosporangium sp. Z 11]